MQEKNDQKGWPGTGKIKKIIKFNGLAGFVRLAWILILLPEINLKSFEHYTHFQLPDVKPSRRKCQKTMNGDFV
jgi:hypothetical protein